MTSTPLTADVNVNAGSDADSASSSSFASTTSLPRALITDFGARAPDLSPAHRLLGRVYQGLFGWKTIGTVPDVPKMVLIASPHTSNWDLPDTWGAAWTLGVDANWFGKDSLFDNAFGWWLRRMGGIPVDRSAANGVVGELTRTLREAERMVLLVPVSGTRGHSPYWKSGFYHIAVAAEVPIGLTYLDYGRKRAGIGALIYPTGDIKADMDAIRAFYAFHSPTGRKPGLASRIRLKVEDEGEGEEK